MASKALILVGGGTRGTRFRPLSLDVPKVLFPVGGKAILSHAVDAVASVPTVKEVILVGFYEDSVFKDFLAQSAKEYSGISFKYLREYKAMGTAGGLYHFRDVILKGSPSKFFVIHADVCCSFPLKEIDELFETKNAKAVIMGTRVEDEVATNFGAIVLDSQHPETKKVVHYVEKPESKISTLVNAGVYLFDKTLFDVIGEAKESRDKALAESTFSRDDIDEDVLRLEQDILVRLPQTDAFYVYESKDFWTQIKSAGSALPANALYLQKQFQSDPHSPGLAAASANIVPPVFIDPTAIIDADAKLGPDVSIGPHAKICKGARIRDSIILNDVEIKHDAVVLHSILSEGSKVGAWSRIEGSPTNLNDYSSTIIKDGVRVQPVSILAANVIVADEVHIQNCVVLPHKEIKSDVKNEVIM